jgi:hypothetical protein
MAEKIKTGDILIREGILLPPGLQLECEPFLKGWRLVKNLNSPAMDRRLSEARWTFFYMAGEIPATAVGFDLEKTARRAVRKVIASMKSDRLNCLEIVQVSAKRFLGLPYVTVSAHPRHIQERMFLSYTERVAECDRAESAVVSG